MDEPVSPTTPTLMYGTFKFSNEYIIPKSHFKLLRQESKVLGFQKKTENYFGGGHIWKCVVWDPQKKICLVN